MKIILLSDVYKHGVAGEVVDVADGFARNYLIPRGLAAKATAGELKRAAKLREQAENRRLEYENMLNELGRKIDGTELVFFRRAAVTGKLFGSVTTAEIADSLMDATGVDINRRRISQQPLRDTGEHEVPVRLGTDVSPVLKIRIIPEDQQAEYKKQMEAINNGLLEALVFDEMGRLVPQKIKQKVDEAEAEAEPTIEDARAAVAAAEAEAESAVEAAGEAVEEAVETAGEAVEEAAESVAEAVEAAVEEDDE